jgi:hypothetical protein
MNTVRFFHDICVVDGLTVQTRTTSGLVPFMGLRSGIVEHQDYDEDANKDENMARM